MTLDVSSSISSYTWINESVTNTSLTVSMEDTYPLYVKGDSICEDTVDVQVIEQCAGIVHVPNAFTPNGDDLNDLFEPYIRFVTDYKITIFNQWGEVVFVSEDETVHWDGEYNGETVPDVYSYKIEYSYQSDGEMIDETKSGYLNLIK